MNRTQQMLQAGSRTVTVQLLPLKENPEPTPTPMEIEGEGNNQTTALSVDLEKQIKSEQDHLNAQVAKEKQETIERQLSDFRSAMDSLNNLNGMYYLATTADGATVANVSGNKMDESFFASLSASMTLHENQSIRYNSYSLYYRPVPKGSSINIGMSQENYRKESDNYQQRWYAGRNGIYLVAFGILAFLLGMGWLLYAAGRKPATEGVQLLPVDGVYLDIGLAAALVIVGFCLASLFGIHNMVSYRPSMNIEIVYFLGALLVICLALTAVVFLTTVAKRLKRHEFLRHTLIYTLCHGCTATSAVRWTPGRWR